MKKRGFTLIELLAVIIILAIIALIATPILMKMVENSKRGAVERSAENYISAVDTQSMTLRTEGTILDGIYGIKENGNLCPNNGTTCSDEEEIKIEMKGTKPSGGLVVISDGRVVSSVILDSVLYETTLQYGDQYEIKMNNDGKINLEYVNIYNVITNLTNATSNGNDKVKSTAKYVATITASSGYTLTGAQVSIVMNGDDITSSVYNNGVITINKPSGDITINASAVKVYANGDEVYFNVATGQKCSEQDYKTGNSDSEYNGLNPTSNQTSCLKFFAFNDNPSSSTLNLILDHNTTNVVNWCSQDDYIEAGGTEEEFTAHYTSRGPLTALKALKDKTENWQGTEAPGTYSVDQRGQTSNAYYTIDYSNYGNKARLITANEVAVITGANLPPYNWEESSTTSYYYYLDTKTQTAPSQDDMHYGWMYDYTGGCKGCAHMRWGTYGYWTASSISYRPSNAWYVYPGTVSFYENAYASSYAGVRPVITVQKSKLN